MFGLAKKRKEAEKRFSAVDALKDPWFKNILDEQKKENEFLIVYITNKSNSEV